MIFGGCSCLALHRRDGHFVGRWTARFLRHDLALRKVDRVPKSHRCRLEMLILSSSGCPLEWGIRTARGPTTGSLDGAGRPAPYVFHGTGRSLVSYTRRRLLLDGGGDLCGS